MLHGRWRLLIGGSGGRRLLLLVCGTRGRGAVAPDRLLLLHGLLLVGGRPRGRCSVAAGLLLLLSVRGGRGCTGLLVRRGGGRRGGRASSTVGGLLLLLLWRWVGG